MAYSMTIEWGDCDSAGMVFYPNYFRWFDSAFQHLLREKNLDQRSLSKRYGIVGTPIADVSARFLCPATFGDAITIDSHISEWMPKLFKVSHVVHRVGQTIAEGHELRFWGISDDTLGTLRAGVIDKEFKTLMAG